MSTPVRQQYLRLKSEHPDALLLFRLGDFYELFDADAEVASRELGLTLTGRQFAKDQRSPMAGVPYHHADTYIAKLVARGYRLAVAEQIGDTQAAKGLVERRIVRVITPGTLLEPGLLESRRNNYLAAILIHGQAAGIAYADVSTGEFYIQYVSGEQLLPTVTRELERISPAEVLWPYFGTQYALQVGSPTAPGPQSLPPPLTLSGCAMTAVDGADFEVDAARSNLAEHLGMASLAGKSYARYGVCLGAAGAILAYLRKTQPASIPILREPVVYHGNLHMTLDAPTRRNLELTQTIRGAASAGSLLAVLDRTQTPMGGRLLKRWLNAPLITLEPLQRRQHAVHEMVSSATLRMRTVEALSGIGDIDRLVCRAQQGTISPRELVALTRALDRLETLRQALGAASGKPVDGATELVISGDSLISILHALDPCVEMSEKIKATLVDDPPQTISDGGFVRSGYSNEIDALDEASKGTREWMASLEASERARTGIKGLKVVYSRVFGYAIEVSKSALSHVPDDYIRRQTVAGGERYITAELKQHEKLLLQAREQRLRVEVSILEELRESVAQVAERLLRSADAVGQVDVYASFAIVAVERSYVRPVLTEGDELRIIAGRHPVVEVSQRDVAFVPNDTLLDDRCRLAVLTGPNMAGKSTYLRQVALIILLGQVGSYVPADSARIGLVDRIFTRVGAQDDLAAGQSTFMVEMVETSAILAECTSRSLLIFDEIGRGTSTFDGLALAQSIIEYIHDNEAHQAKTIFATHYHELTGMASARAGIQNFRMDVLEEGNAIVFLRKVVPGGADKAYGIYVASLAGLPQSVVRRAKALLHEYETGATPRMPRRRLREEPSMQMRLFPSGE